MASEGAVPEDEADTSGERIDPRNRFLSRADYASYCFHAATYTWAAGWADGTRALDLGTGTGYGAHTLAERARHVTAVDLSAGAVAAARLAYSAPNLTFRQIDDIESSRLPFADGSFDLVTSFQVVEHVHDAEAYAREVARVLAPGGVFLCVTPDRRHRLIGRQHPWNPYHVTEFTPKQLVDVLEPHLSVETVAGMTASSPLLDVELDRYRRSRRRAYVYTFPGAPPWWRRRAPGVLRRAKHLLRRSPAPQRGRTPTTEHGFSPADVRIGPGADPSVNICVVARHPRS